MLELTFLQLTHVAANMSLLCCPSSRVASHFLDANKLEGTESALITTPEWCIGITLVSCSRVSPPQLVRISLFVLSTSLSAAFTA